MTYSFENLVFDRQFARLSDEVRFDPYGFTISRAGSDWQGKTSTYKAFNELTSVPCLVILGTPASGKSTQLQRLYEQVPERRRLMVDLKLIGTDTSFHLQFVEKFRSKFSSLQPNESLDLFVDSLDEGMLRVSVLAELLADQLLAVEASLLNFRVACRPTEWPVSLERALQKKWGEGTEIRKLIPLSTDDLSRTCDEAGIDERRFRTELFRTAAGPLAAQSPADLLDLADEFLKGNESLPASRWELHQKRSERDCRDENPGNLGRALRVGNMRITDPEQRLIIAARIAALKTLCGRAVLFDDSERGSFHGNSAIYEAPLRLTEAGGEPIENDLLQVNAVAARDTLDTRLFSAGDGTYLFAHQTREEFLTAYYLVKARSLPLQSLCRLLTTSERPNRVAPSLRAVASWVAEADVPFRQWLINNDPAIILPASSTLSEGERCSLAEKLLEAAQRHQVSWRNLYYNTGGVLSGLKAESIGDKLRPYLDRSKSDPGKENAKALALSIARSVKVKEVQEDLINIALNEDEIYGLRTLAAGAIADFGDEDTRKKLFPLLADSNPDEDLKGLALKALYPMHLSFKDLTLYLQPVKKRSYLGSYVSFLQNVGYTISAQELVEATNWVADQDNTALSGGSYLYWLSRTLLERAGNLIAGKGEDSSEDVCESALQQLLTAVGRLAARVPKRQSQIMSEPDQSADLQGNQHDQRVNGGQTSIGLDSRGAQDELLTLLEAIKSNMPGAWEKFYQGASTHISLTDEQQAQVVNAARRFLEARPVDGNDALFPTVLAVLHKVTQNSDVLQLVSIPSEVWEAWMPHVVEFVINPKGVEFYAPGVTARLLATVYNVAREPFLQRLVETIRDTGSSRLPDANQLLAVLDERSGMHDKDLWREILSFSDVGKDEDGVTQSQLPPDTRRTLLSWVLRATRDSAMATQAETVPPEHLTARAWLASLLADPGQRIESGYSLFQEDYQAGWEDYLWPLMNNDSQFATQWLSALTAQDLLGTNTFALWRLSEEHLEQFFTFVTDRLPSDESDALEDLGILRRTILQALGERGTTAALAAYSRLVQKYPENIELQLNLISAEEVFLRRTWRPFRPSDVKAILSDASRDGVKRALRTSADLHEAVKDSLKRLCVGSNNYRLPENQIDFLWNNDPRQGEHPKNGRPKAEAALSNYVALHLQRDMANHAVLVNREVQVNPSADRMDIIVEVSGDDLPNGRLTHVIEVKGCWNGGIDTSQESQLIKQYLQPRRCEHGIYLIGWFLCDFWEGSQEDNKVDLRYEATKKLYKKREDIVDSLVSQSKLLSQCHNLTVEAIVIDATR